MRQAAIGDIVRVHYTGKLGDGTEFDSSVKRGPLEVTLGGGQVIAGFEKAILGMAEGETKSVTLEAHAAYGPRREELIYVIERAEVPDTVDLHVGAELQASDDDGKQTNLIVLEVTDDSVTLDANHPLAGAALTFDLELTGFVD